MADCLFFACWFGKNAVFIIFKLIKSINVNAFDGSSNKAKQFYSEKKVQYHSFS